MSFLARLSIALSLALPVAVAAQTDGTQDPDQTAPSETPVANGQRFGAWTISCLAVAVGQTECTLTQRVLRSSDNAFVADLIALRTPEAATFLIARVPIGAFLPNRFAMREAASEDGSDVMEFTWQTCNRDFCEALLQMSPEQVTALSAQDNAMIAAFRPSAQVEPFLFQLSLSGMAQGLDAIGP